jgi:mRNA interferase YafQ
MLNPKRTSQFKRDFKRMRNQGADMDAINNVMERLIQELPLDRRCHDHPMTGDWKDHRDCHIKSDWVLIYRIDGVEINFVRTGSHSEISI